MDNQNLIKALRYAVIYLALEEEKRGNYEVRKIIDALILYDKDDNDFVVAFSDLYVRAVASGSITNYYFF